MASNSRGTRRSQRRIADGSLVLMRDAIWCRFLPRTGGTPAMASYSVAPSE
jgi:hypothetical protein